MHTLRLKHWLKLTCVWAGCFALIDIVTAFVVARQFPALNYLPLVIAFGALVATLQYRRDLTLSVRESFKPWFLSAIWLVAFVFLGLTLDVEAPAFGARCILASSLGLAFSSLCLFPLRWVISSFGPSRYAP
jgi:hypothetical protein